MLGIATGYDFKNSKSIVRSCQNNSSHMESEVKHEYQIKGGVNPKNTKKCFKNVFALNDRLIP